MKNLISTITMMMTLILTAISVTIAVADTGGTCNKNFYYETITHGHTYPAGKDIYVKVKAQYHYDIAYMDLYVNGYKVRRENQAQYEWGRPHGGGDHRLRNMKPGTYKIKCVAKTKCGSDYYKEITIYVKGKKKTCTNNFWYVYAKHGSSCQKGQDLYVKVDAERHADVEYMELYINNHFVRRENYAHYEWGKPNTGGDHQLRNMRKGTYYLKCKIKTKCGEVIVKKSTITVR